MSKLYLSALKASNVAFHICWSLGTVSRSGAPAPPCHIHHEGSETFFVLEGELTLQLADSRVVVGSGGCLHLPPGTPHTLASEGAVMARAFEIFIPRSLMGLVEDVGALFASGMPPDRARLLEVFTRPASELVG